MIKGYDIICFASDWDDPWGSKQRLMQILSKQNRVLYVEYPISLLHLLFYPRLRRKVFQPPLRRINENIVVYTPPFVLPFGFYSRMINKANHFLLYASIRRYLRLLKFKNLILWTFLPMSVDLIGKLQEKLLIYHCAADFPHEKNNRLRRELITRMEKELVSKADIVLAFTEQLYREHKQDNPNTYLFRSAVHYNLFFQTLQEKSPEPRDIAILKRPRIGIVGYLDGKILDVELLKYIVSAHPDWSVILIGPRYRNTKELDTLSDADNIYFLGKKSEPLLPYYIKGLDVCLIPYVINDFTKNISPLKLYEYLSMGRPVVSTALPELNNYTDVAKIAYTKEEFSQCIEQCLNDNDSGRIHARCAIAKENSWGNRIAQVSEIIKVKIIPDDLR